MTSIEYVPIDEVSKKLHVSNATVRGWVRKNIIPPHTYIRVGKTYRFHIDSVVGALQEPHPLQQARRANYEEDEFAYKLAAGDYEEETGSSDVIAPDLVKKPDAATHKSDDVDDDV